MFKPEKLTGFAARALGAILIFSFACMLAGPYYNRLLVAAANFITPLNFSLDKLNGDIYFYSSAGVPLGGIHGTARHFGMVLLLALLVATPGFKSLKRLREIGIGLVIMPVLHTGTLALIAGLAQMSAGTSSNVTNMPTVLISSIGLNLIPVLVWAGFCLRRLFQDGFQNIKMPSAA
jgi:hypothetical protein